MFHAVDINVRGKKEQGVIKCDHQFSRREEEQGG